MGCLHRPLGGTSSTSFLFPIAAPSSSSIPIAGCLLAIDVASNPFLALFFSSRPGDDLPFVRRFKPREIEAATSGFSTALETGGPRGTAYRARFADGLVATVRRVAGGDRDHDHQEQHGAFYRELQLLGRLNHRHVVRLRGFSEGHNRLLHGHSSCFSLILISLVFFGQVSGV
jgi:hypothetical protein